MFVWRSYGTFREAAASAQGGQRSAQQAKGDLKRAVPTVPCILGLMRVAFGAGGEQECASEKGPMPRLATWHHWPLSLYSLYRSIQYL